MSLIPLAIVIAKLSLSLGLVFFGIRALLVSEPKTDNFVYDVRRLIDLRRMRKRGFWVTTGIVCILLGSVAFVLLFLV